MNKIIIIAFIILFSCFVVCDINDGQNSPVYIYQVPLPIADGWETSSLTAHAIDESLITEMITEIKENVFKNIHGILILRDGKLLLEEYFTGEAFLGGYTFFNRNTLHYLASTTKSFTFALVGIAFDYGFITNFDAPLFSFFPEYPDINWSGIKQTITLLYTCSTRPDFTGAVYTTRCL